MLDILADRLDHPGPFMAEADWIAMRRPVAAMLECQIGRANPDHLDPDAHLRASGLADRLAAPADPSIAGQDQNMRLFA
jgi:hypothetical protein